MDNRTNNYSINNGGEELARLNYELYRQGKTIEKQNKLITVIMAVCAAMLIISIISAIIIVPPAARFFSSVSELGDSVKLSDIVETIEEIDLLVSESREGVEQAAVKIESFDVETLNDTIASLNSIIEPLARLFGGGE